MWFDSLRKRLRAKDALSHKWLLEHVKAGRFFLSGLQKSSPRTLEHPLGCLKLLWALLMNILHASYQDFDTADLQA